MLSATMIRLLKAAQGWAEDTIEATIEYGDALDSQEPEPSFSEKELSLLSLLGIVAEEDPEHAREVLDLVSSDEAKGRDEAPKASAKPTRGGSFRSVHSSTDKEIRIKFSAKPDVALGEKGGAEFRDYLKGLKFRFHRDGYWYLKGSPFRNDDLSDGTIRGAFLSRLVKGMKHRGLMQSERVMVVDKGTTV